MLYNKTVQWLVLLNMPYFIVVIPFIDVLSFNWLYHVITHYYSKPTAASSEIGYFLTLLMNLIFLYQVGFLGLWFMFPRFHKCGPLPDESDGW